jgi:hypothetical protein
MDLGTWALSDTNLSLKLQRERKKEWEHKYIKIQLKPEGSNAHV